MKSTASLQKFLYATIILLALGFLGITIGAVYGRWEQEQRNIVSLIFYIGVVLGAIGFVLLAGIMYYKFRQRNQFGVDDK